MALDITVMNGKCPQNFIEIGISEFEEIKLCAEKTPDVRILKLKEYYSDYRFPSDKVPQLLDDFILITNKLGKQPISSKLRRICKLIKEASMNNFEIMFIAD